MQAEGGAAGFVDIVARLLSATFAGPAAPIVGAIAGEIVSGLTEALDPPRTRRQHPLPLAGRGRGGGRNGGNTGSLAPKEGRAPPPLSLGRRDGRRPRPAPPAAPPTSGP